MDMIVTDQGSNPVSITENKLVQSAQEASISTPTLEACDWSNNAAPVDVLDGKPVDMTPSLFQTTPGAPVIRRSCTAPEAEIASNEQGSNTISTSRNKLVQLMFQKQKLISPAFGNHILWPSDSPIKKKAKESLPLAVTSKYFIDYFEKKKKKSKRS
ncbi:unnamed protein product [Parnassius apollo]|uniref:(apollo) hypothetical protein n=1 Tax=Parnassius apollo TaxID=110799 RepID=A0A8S3WFE4_PARAO|nr:unnamed protein product [Parnassius apollo]